MRNQKYFKLAELIKSTTAKKLGIANVPNFNEVYNLYRLTDKVLTPSRILLGEPITINSGYRCTALNKAVGGKTNSQHIQGLAADIKCKSLDTLFEILKRNEYVDQLIFETKGKTKWIHVSIAPVGTTPRHIVTHINI